MAVTDRRTWALGGPPCVRQDFISRGSEQHEKRGLALFTVDALGVWQMADTTFRLMESPALAPAETSVRLGALGEGRESGQNQVEHLGNFTTPFTPATPTQAHHGREISACLATGGWGLG